MPVFTPQEFKPYNPIDVYARAAPIMSALQKQREAEQEQARASYMQTLSSKAYEGDEQAKLKIGAMDPDRLKDIQDGINKMDEGERKRVLHELELKARALNRVLSLPPAVQPEAYARMRAELERMNLGKGLSEQYDPELVNDQVSMGMKIADMITSSQKDLMAQGLEKGTKEFQAELDKKTDKGGTKFTKSDRIMALARKMSEGKATDSEKKEYELLINADPFRMLLRDRINEMTDNPYDNFE